MKKLLHPIHWLIFQLFLSVLVSCSGKNTAPSNEAIKEINLKKGAIILCGPADSQFGSVGFETSCSSKIKDDFNLAIALLHSFEYDEAEKVFAKVIEKQPDCAMAYWGAAMSNFHPLWAPPSEAELLKGEKAIAIAHTISNKSKREESYINAIATFYAERDRSDHRSRCIKFEKAMENLTAAFPTDKEAAIFYALSLTAAADPADQTFTKQKKAGSILHGLYPGQPNHPGIVHYIIHTYDSPELAESALVAARKYAAVAPSSAHALHMPSHIFTRMGLWSECIESNLASVSSAQCYAESAGIKGHWDEELHALDYLVYAYLQKGENNLAKKQCDYLQTMQVVSPVNFKVAYAFAAIPARYVLENKMWKDAAGMQIFPADFNWEKFPWQKAIFHFCRLMGLVHTGSIDAAKAELIHLNLMNNTLLNQKNDYYAKQVQIQILTAKAWILIREGKNNEALKLMQEAASMEDNIEKHPVTPGEVIPARELLGEMYIEMNNPTKALEAFEADLKKRPNRFNAVFGAAESAEKMGNFKKAHLYYLQLTGFASATSNRMELQKARLFLKNKNSSL